MKDTHTLCDAIRWVSYEAFARPLHVIGLA